MYLRIQLFLALFHWYPEQHVIGSLMLQNLLIPVQHAFMFECIWYVSSHDAHVKIMQN